MTKPELTCPGAPEAFLGEAIPDEVRAQWNRWEGAEWRRMRHMSTNQLDPPDQRFSVRAPSWLCERHHRNWLGYRNMIFDPASGNCWPGLPGSPFVPIDRDLRRERARRRCQWDEKASLQMRLVEGICRSRNSCVGVGSRSALEAEVPPRTAH
ncbi:hypothetical protein PV726_31265 [Streptomyces europaeiscabiei]|nr:hypothetical protein [Streptomyces europaeiscabiei]